MSREQLTGRIKGFHQLKPGLLKELAREEVTLTVDFVWEKRVDEWANKIMPAFDTHVERLVELGWPADDASLFLYDVLLSVARVLAKQESQS